MDLVHAHYSLESALTLCVKLKIGKCMCLMITFAIEPVADVSMQPRASVYAWRCAH